MKSKKVSRLERKKRKVEAFLEIAKLNDDDRLKKPRLEDEEEKTTENPPRKDPSKPLLENEEYQELRRRLRERKKALQYLPKFDLKASGHDASIDNLETQRKPLFMSDLQHLLMFALIGDRAPYQPYRWCKLEKWNRVSNMVVLVVDGGLGVKDFIENREELKEFNSIFPNKLQFLSPVSYDSTTAEELAVLSLSSGMKTKIIEKFKDLKSAIDSHEMIRVHKALFTIKNRHRNPEKPGQTNSLKLKLLLNAEQMIQENYPLPLPGLCGERFSDYVMTNEEYEIVHEDSPMYSVDCEMCVTNVGKMELTRVCVVDSDLKVIYHSLVKPENKITNYLTRYSGITEEMLRDVTTELRDVQNALRSLIPPDAILIGQSLNSDLTALKMMHPYVIDTSVIYCTSGDRKRKTKLSILSNLFLNKDIQDLGKSGHNPIEDAQAAMELVLLKLKKGYAYGDVLLNGEVPNAVNKSDDKKEGLPPVKELATTIFKQIKEKKMKVIGDGESLEVYKTFHDENVLSTPSKSCKEAVKKACEEALNNDLVICHVTETSLKKIRKWTKRLWGHTSQNGLFVTVWSGSPNQDAFVAVALNKI